MTDAEKNKTVFIFRMVRIMELNCEFIVKDSSGLIE